MIRDYKIDIQQTPQISKEMAKKLTTLGREYVKNSGKMFIGGDRKKTYLQNDWLIFRRGVRGRYLFVF